MRAFVLGIALYLTFNAASAIGLSYLVGIESGEYQGE